MSRPSTSVDAVHLEMGTTTTRTANTSATRSLRRFAGWLSALLADDGVSARFAAERRRDDDLVRRVERRPRP